MAVDSQTNGRTRRRLPFWSIVCLIAGLLSVTPVARASSAQESIVDRLVNEPGIYLWCDDFSQLIKRIETLAPSPIESVLELIELRDELILDADWKESTRPPLLLERFEELVELIRERLFDGEVAIVSRGSSMSNGQTFLVGSTALSEEELIDAFELVDHFIQDYLDQDDERKSLDESVDFESAHRLNALPIFWKTEDSLLFIGVSEPALTLAADELRRDHVTGDRLLDSREFLNSRTQLSDRAFDAGVPKFYIHSDVCSRGSVQA